MDNLIMVNGSIEFRDAVLRLNNEGHKVCVRLGGEMGPGEYRVIVGSSVDAVITLENLFGGERPPVMMEDFATALVRADKVPIVEVFTL